ncbi:hypothetical protein, partial [Streptomyces sp. NPDC002346]
WTLTDWFENVYLSQAGPEKYDQLAQHKIKWTRCSLTFSSQCPFHSRFPGSEGGRQIVRLRGAVASKGS